MSNVFGNVPVYSALGNHEAQNLWVESWGQAHLSTKWFCLLQTRSIYPQTTSRAFHFEGSHQPPLTKRTYPSAGFTITSLCSGWAGCHLMRLRQLRPAVITQVFYVPDCVWLLWTTTFVSRLIGGFFLRRAVDSESISVAPRLSISSRKVRRKSSHSGTHTQQRRGLLWAMLARIPKDCWQISRDHRRAVCGAHRIFRF